MSTYIPDSWVVLKINHNDETLYKVLAGWSGGYTQGNSWRMNSGITEVKSDHDGNLFFYGESGSVYNVHPENYRLTMAVAGVYNKLKEQVGDFVEMMPKDTDWLSMDWRAQ
jgi:hypothetical protein